MTAFLKPGEAFRLRSGGGGGFGAAIESDPELVRNDVEQSYVSVHSARKHYGVVIDGESLQMDLEATRALRAEMTAAERAEPGDSPS